MNWRGYIPDGTKIRQKKVTLVVFNPAWWRVDRWIFWAWLLMFGRKGRRGIASFTALREGKVQRFQLPVYEE